MMEPFVPPYSQPAVDDLRLRLRQTRWPETVSGANSSLGVDREFLEDLCGYWANTFDWKAQFDLSRLSITTVTKLRKGSSTSSMRRASAHLRCRSFSPTVGPDRFWRCSRFCLF